MFNNELKNNSQSINHLG